MKLPNDLNADGFLERVERRRCQHRDANPGSEVEEHLALRRLHPRKSLREPNRVDLRERRRGGGGASQSPAVVSR